MRNTIILSIVFILFSSCSSVTVSDYWKKESLSDFSQQRVLVINQFGDEVARIRFEHDMVDALSSKGITAFQSSEMFPEVKPKEKLAQKEIDKFKANLEAANIELVVMTVLKEKEEYQTTSSQGGVYGAGMPFYPGYFGGGYYGGGFYGYYGSFYAPSYSTSTTTTNEKYIIETVVYDLRQEKKNQMISVITMSIDNPKTLGSSSQEVSKVLVKELTKKVK